MLTRCLRNVERMENQKPPPGIHNLEAVHTLSLLWPLLGMLFPAGYSASVYLDADTAYRGDEVGRMQYTPTTALGFAEPFAAGSNLSYFLAGVGLFVMPFLSGDHMPAPTFAIAVFLCTLGGASMAFHADGSQGGTWQHQADRYAMYMPFAYLSVATFNGLLHACRGVPASPRSLWGFITNIGGLSFATYCLVFQEGIDSFQFLMSSGAVIFSVDFATLATLHFHRMRKEGLAEHDDMRMGNRGSDSCRSSMRIAAQAALRALPTLATRLTYLGIAFVLRLDGYYYRELSLKSDAEHAAERAAAGLRATNVSIGERIEWRRMYDFLHGSWHFLTAVVIMGLGLTLVEGLSGELRAPSGVVVRPATAYSALSRGAAGAAARGVPLTIEAMVLQVASSTRGFVNDYARHFRREDSHEVLSMVASFALPIVLLLLHIHRANSSVWLAVWLAFCCLLVPFEIFALCRIARRHNRQVRDLLERAAAGGDLSLSASPPTAVESNADHSAQHV
jgi:hypothetical protein